MREPSIAIALSVLVHGAGIVWFASRDTGEHLHALAATAPRVEPVTPPPIEVVFLDDATSARFEGLGPRAQPGSQSQSRATSHVVATQAADELPAKPAEPVVVKKPSLFKMRSGPEIHRPGSDGISDETLEKMVNGELDPHIANLPGAREAAAFDRADAKLHDSRFLEHATADEITGVRFDRLAAREAQKAVELVAHKDGTYTSDKKTYQATVNRDGTVAIKDKPNWQWKSMFYAEFDVGDAFLRSHGMDPYASAKLAYLDRTRDQRVEIGKRYRAAQLGQSGQIMAANLDHLWRTVADPAERKTLLFMLWDECAETGDDELVDGASEARRVLINFIQVKGVTYAAAELAALNAKKQSRATFAP